MNTTLQLLIIEDHYIMRVGLKYTIHNFGFGHDIQILDSKSIEEIKTFLAENAHKIVIVDSTFFANQSKMFLSYTKSDTARTSVLVLYENSDFVDYNVTVRFDNIVYISKNAHPQELKLALNKLKRGESYCSNPISNMVDLSLTTDHLKDLNLTKREKEVLALVLKNMTSREISETMFLSQRTIETHRYNLLKKLKESHIYENNSEYLYSIFTNNDTMLQRRS
ncbi:LuxR C-terminal-related transcriptional regulator [Niabella hirudinis]|uniref:LuxR C-terminal-related transcriptional regulator n=1 Tax=Niabella hirudinis TaxID=1285929 RepID=UPI003EB6AE8F